MTRFHPTRSRPPHKANITHPKVPARTHPVRTRRLALSRVIACVFVPGLAVAQVRDAAPGRSGPDEFRGMWVTRFEWPDPDPAKARQTIDAIMADLAAAHFNAVLFQVRGQADVFYPSPEEPWSPLIAPDGRDPGWDPLAYAIEAAHHHGLEFHAYINTHVAWQSVEHQPPADPEHLYYRHCNAEDPDARDWLIHDADGRPVQYGSDDYVWLAPGVPACQAYIRRQIMYVVNHYDVDGVHFDRIRTPGPGFSHDPISLARQAPGSEGNPEGLDFADWTRDQITRLLRDLYAQIMEAKPDITVSCAPAALYRRERYPDYPASFFYGWSRAYQDAQTWLAAGAVDMVVPQIYWADGGRPPHFTEVLTDWVNHGFGRHIAAGQNRFHSLRQLADQVRVTRALGACGNVMFHYGGFKKKGGFRYFSRRGGVYELPARTPAMAWKTHPTTGVILGYVTAGESGRPITDAQVVLDDGEDIALSSGDGLYSFLQVLPGMHTLTFRKHGYQLSTAVNVTVIAGLAAHVDMVMEPLLAESADRPQRPNDDTGTGNDAQPTHPTDERHAGGFALVLTLAAGLIAAGLCVVLIRRHRRREKAAPASSGPVSPADGCDE